MSIAKLCANAYELLEKATNPLFFFDDDVDGLVSALLLYKHFGKGTLCPSYYPEDQFYDAIQRKQDEYSSDCLVFVDISKVPQDVKQLASTIIIIDHHGVQDISGVLQINPRMFDDEDIRPTSHWCFEILKRPEKLLWLAQTGIVSDWQLTDVHDQFKVKYDTLMNNFEDVTAPQLIFTTPLGKLIRMLLFNLKGSSKEVKQAVHRMKQLESPYELLNGTTSAGRWLKKRFEKQQKEYDSLWADVKKNADITDRHVIYKYSQYVTSFSAHLANQLLYEHPDKLIVIARLKSGAYRCSLRTPPHLNVRNGLDKAIQKYGGTGGGHPQACGARIDEDIFSEFVETMESEIFS